MSITLEDYLNKLPEDQRKRAEARGQELIREEKENRDRYADSEIHELIHPILDEYHIQNVVEYLAKLCENVKPNQISDGDVKPFRFAAHYLNSAADTLGKAQYHEF